MDGTGDETRLGHGRYLYAVEEGGRIRMRPSRSMVLQPRKVGYMSGKLGDEGSASGHCHVREAA